MQPKQIHVLHTSRETYTVTLGYTCKEVQRIRRMTPDGQIIPEKIVVVWERADGRPWCRVTGRQDGSRAWGYVKVAGLPGAGGAYRSREIFTPTLKEIQQWADYLMPGLRIAISDAESTLPV